MNKVKVCNYFDLKDKEPSYACVVNVDIVIIRYKDTLSVLYGRCLHRGALLSDGFVQGDNLICGLHGWDYRIDTGISEYNNEEKLHKFNHWIENGEVFVDKDEFIQWEKENPQAYNREEYQGLYQDIHGTESEPHVNLIQSLAKNGLKKFGHHGPTGAMGVERDKLPSWDDIQILTAQLYKLPLLDDEHVSTELIIGPNAKKALKLDIPIFVSDMSFGALSEEAKVALAKGAEGAGTGICSGEGGMLAEEKAENSKYFYELASGRFGFSMDKLDHIQAFHFKGGQGAKTGTGGHLPGSKVKGKIAEVRGLKEGEAAVSPSRFPDWNSLNQYREFADEVRTYTAGIPIGYKLSAQHIEKDIDAALEIGVDYIILDGRGGGTGAAPLIFRDNISIPTMVAIARARKHLDDLNRKDITLIATGGLRTASDFVKAMALGADGIAVSNSALQAIGCLGMRACHTNNCPVGIATQKEGLRKRLIIDKSAANLTRFFESTVQLMSVLARACGHNHLNQFEKNDLVTWKKDISELTGISYAGIGGQS